jgi:hypothetical protein
MVSVETALAIPALLLTAFSAATIPALVAASVACTDAAREAALLTARGGHPAQVQAVVDRLVPGRASVRLSRDADLVEVVVTTQVAVRPLGDRVAVTLDGRAVAALER